MNKIVFTLNPNIKSPTFIASADIHLGKKLYNMPELGEDLKDNFVRLADLAITKKVNYLVIAGDLFEDNLNVKPYMIRFVSNIVDKLRKYNIRLVGVNGDHDRPIKGESWMHISDIQPVTIEPTFAGINYFDYSSVSIEELIKLIKDGLDCNKVLWIFLHCQFPQLFKRAEPKKTIDYNRLEIFKNFPNIQGIIAGDIHSALETKAYGVNHEAYVGYPGSLGVTDKTEFKHNKHVLWCDGKNLIHLPFPLIRTTTDIDFRGEKADKFDINAMVKWAHQQPIKPVIYVHYDKESEKQKAKFAPLYDCALVVPNQVAVGVVNPEDNMSVVRGETSTEDKVESALRYHCGNDDNLYNLAASLLKDDPKDVLDKFKTNYEYEQARILENK